MSILSEKLLAVPTGLFLGHDEKDVYAVSVGLCDKASGGQVIAIRPLDS